MSLIELAWRLDLYTIEETEDEACLAYLKRCLVVQPKDFNHAEIWKKIGDEYVPYDPKETYICDITQPIHRLLHKMF